MNDDFKSDQPASIVTDQAQEAPPAETLPEPLEDHDFRVLALDTIEPEPVVMDEELGDLPDFAVFITRNAVTNILRHCEKGLQSESEVAGGLIGFPRRDSRTGKLFTFISAAPALHGHADRYEVVILPEEWSDLSNRIEAGDFGATEIIVGWYHSHPTFEAYLSLTDQLTQSQFFSEQWNIAIVVGPLLQQIKAFHSGLSIQCPIYLDPAETGGQLLPVTYEVSAGPVSTADGIEIVVPRHEVAAAATPARDTGFTPIHVAEAEPHAPPIEAVLEPIIDPAPGAIFPAPAARLGVPPFILGLLALAMLVAVVLILLLFLILRH